MKQNCWLIIGSLLFVFAFATNSALALQEDRKISFDKEIRPLLSDRCYACHGLDSSTRQSELRLDLKEESHGRVIEPGSPSDSELWLRISSDDASIAMPPSDSHKKRFSENELNLIRQWIEQGAEYEKYWAFQKIEPNLAPPIEDREFTSPVDRWVAKELAARDLTFSPQADTRTLLRRSALDLTGLPPTPNEIRKFLLAESQLGFEAAWEDWTDGLLKSSRFGEHMARYWLDLVRYADTNGMHKDFYRNHYSYRDWVIRAFNENLPYDHFLTYQLAGDMYESPTQDQLTASAFNRLHMIIDRGTALPEESFHKNVVDRVTAVSTAFLGLTMQCAQCHDHKYDPISQKEFYAFYGFFNNFDTQPETVASPDNGLQPPYICLADETQQREIAEYQRQIESVSVKISGLKQALNEIEDSSIERQRLEHQLEQLQQNRRQLKFECSNFNRNVPYAMISKERQEPRPTYLLERGEYDSLGEQVDRGTPAFLPPLDFTGRYPTRMDLANWLVSEVHPLTARVAVNRIWQNLMGRGIVHTSEDFGSQGSFPTHRELLDHLAWSFMQTGWNVKRLVKSIVRTKTYRQSSHVSERDLKNDPENRWLARGSRFRLDAEVLRDQLLLTSGNLVERMYGRSVKPPQPDGLWASVSMTGERFVADSGDDIHRRSLYTFWKRAMPPPQMTLLNAPMRDSCVARRERTNTPAQALLLLNEPTYFLAGRKLAVRALQEKPDDRIGLVWEIVTGTIVDRSEAAVLETLLDELTTHYAANHELANKICEGAPQTSATAVQVAAWTGLVNTIYNLDVTRTRN